MGKEYATTKRAAVYEYLKEHSEKTVSVTDITEFLEQQEITMNITSIYRYLDKLYNQKVILKYVAEKGGKTTYQYIGEKRKCSEHLHIQCTKCGKVSHLDCNFMKKLYAHIETEHGYSLQCSNSILYGMCNECKSLHEGEEG